MSTAATIEIARVLAETSVGHVHYLSTTDSTNNVALERAGQLPDDQSELVLAGQQTSGRGRGTNQWFSSAGSLTFSLITPLLPIQTGQTPAVSLVTGLAGCLAAERHAGSAQASIKWPNDVFLNGKKAAGVLIEVAQPATPRFVIGVGVNVNNSLQEAPQEVQARATSLREAAGSPVDATLFLIDFLNLLEALLGQLAANDANLTEQWRSHCFLTDRQVTIDLNGKKIAGTCRGIAEDGALLIACPSGVTRVYGGAVESY